MCMDVCRWKECVSSILSLPLPSLICWRNSHSSTTVSWLIRVERTVTGTLVSQRLCKELVFGAEWSIRIIIIFRYYHYGLHSHVDLCMLHTGKNRRKMAGYPGTIHVLFNWNYGALWAFVVQRYTCYFLVYYFPYEYLFLGIMPLSLTWRFVLHMSLNITLETNISNIINNIHSIRNPNLPFSQTSIWPFGASYGWRSLPYRDSDSPLFWASTSTLPPLRYFITDGRMISISSQVVPFLSLGLGIDDMFLLLHNYDEISNIVWFISYFLEIALDILPIVFFKI